MNNPHPKLPQRKAHKHMSGEEMLDKIAHVAAPKTPFTGLAVNAPKRKVHKEPDLAEIYKRKLP